MLTTTGTQIGGAVGAGRGGDLVIVEAAGGHTHIGDVHVWSAAGMHDQRENRETQIVGKQTKQGSKTQIILYIVYKERL